MTAGNNTHRKTSSATDSATDSTQRQSNPSGYTTSAGERAAGKARERLITRDVALIMAATFFYMTSSMMGTPIIAGFSQSLGASGALMGFLAGALSLSALICRPIAGNLSDRTSKRKLAVIGALIFLASNLGYYFVPNTAWLLAARILNGVGFACISVCLSTWLSMLLPISRMGAGMGLYGTMNALAQAVGPDLGIRASKAIGYRNTFLIAVGLTCCIVICVLLIKDGGKPPRARLGRQQGGERHHIRLDSLFEPRVIPIALIFMLFAIPYFANQSFIVDYANARHAHVIVSLFFPCYAITLLISRIVLRNWFDTKSFLFFMVTGTICQIVMLASLTVMRNNWFVMLAGLATVGAYGHDELGHAGARRAHRRQGTQRHGEHDILCGHRSGHVPRPAHRRLPVRRIANHLVLPRVVAHDASRMDCVRLRTPHHSKQRARAAYLRPAQRAPADIQ